MYDKLFLYRDKEANDRDCCAYIEDKNFENRFECGHYFASIGICGGCYFGADVKDYDEVDTVLTESEYNELIQCDKDFHELGYGIEQGSERYNEGMAICERLEPILEKLRSDEAKAFFADIIESEKEYVMDEYSLTEEDVESVFNEFYGEFQDRSIVLAVYDDFEELGQYYADEVECISDRLSNYFDYEAYGRDIFNSDERFIELSDGRIVEYSC